MSVLNPERVAEYHLAVLLQMVHVVLVRVCHPDLCVDLVVRLVSLLATYAAANAPSFAFVSALDTLH